MRAVAHAAIIALAFTLPIFAQDAASPSQNPAATGNSPAQQQKNAASATQDNSGTTGDQITKPAQAKGSTVIGCLSGPDKEGKYTLRNMNHRTGVQVLGPDDLKNNSGSKVKLTGQWQAVATPPPTTAADKKPAEMPRFQMTDIEVLAPTCQAPTETTPVSKNKRQKATTYNAPSSDSEQ
jgi:hypothetical protein